MKNKFFLGLLTIVVITTLSSCNKVPQAELDAVNKSVSDAQLVGADQYLPLEYAALEDSLNAVTVKIEVKKSKWFAKYGTESEKLKDIDILAKNLIQNTEIRKEEIIAEINSTLAEVQTILEENNELLTKAPKGKEGAAALEAIKEDIKVIEGSMNEINALVTQGMLLQAQTKVNAASEKALSINIELKEAIAKYNKRK